MNSFKGLRISSSFLYLFVAFLSFSLSLSLLNSYTYGDQFFYRQFYDAVYNASSLQSIIDYSKAIIGASEPISLGILWLGSWMQIDKDIWISFLNSIMCVLILVHCRRNKLNVFDISLFLVNFYVLVLMTSAERLKISFIFIFMGLMIPSMFKWFFYALAVLSHFQNLILIPSFLIASQINSIRLFLFKLRLRYSFFTLIILSFCFMAGFLFYNYNDIEAKLQFYLLSSSFSDYFQASIIFLIALYLCKDKLRLSLSLFPIIVPIALIGATRINILIFFAATALLFDENYFNEKRRIVDFLSFRLVLIYLGYKSVTFVDNIYSLGDGYG